MDWAKTLNTIGRLVNLAPKALTVVAGGVVAAQHMLPGASGTEKKSAAIQLVELGLAGLQAFAPGTAGRVATDVLNTGDAVQAVFDFIQATDPAKLQVHSDNTQPLVLSGAGAGAGAAGGPGGAGGPVAAGPAAAPQPGPGPAGAGSAATAAPGGVQASATAVPAANPNADRIAALNAQISSAQAELAQIQGGGTAGGGGGAGTGGSEPQPGPGLHNVSPA